MRYPKQKRSCSNNIFVVKKRSDGILPFSLSFSLTQFGFVFYFVKFSSFSINLRMWYFMHCFFLCYLRVYLSTVDTLSLLTNFIIMDLTRYRMERIILIIFNSERINWRTIWLNEYYCLMAVRVENKKREKGKAIRLHSYYKWYSLLQKEIKFLTTNFFTHLFFYFTYSGQSYHYNLYICMRNLLRLINIFIHSFCDDRLIEINMTVYL